MCALSWSLYVKYLFDRVAAAGLLVFTLPLFAVVAVGLRLQGHDVFFAQERVGQHGGTLRVLKFTTMPTGSEELGYLTPAGDRRPFRLGRILRRTKLNELPQLINVIRGEMSLVGPRPMIRRHLAESLSEREICAYLPDAAGHHRGRFSTIRRRGPHPGRSGRSGCLLSRNHSAPQDGSGGRICAGEDFSHGCPLVDPHAWSHRSPDRCTPPGGLTDDTGRITFATSPENWFAGSRSGSDRVWLLAVRRYGRPRGATKSKLRSKWE